VPLLQSLGIKLDMLVLSHRDTDHTGGAPALLAMYPQAQLLSSIADDHPLQSLRTAQRCEAGQTWEWDGVQFQVLHPQAEDYGQPLKPNALSCVLRITAGTLAGEPAGGSVAGSASGHADGNSALLVGDIEAPQEQLLVAGGLNLHADVLLVPHHGSKTSSTTAFLDAVDPSLAMVQSGYRNRFGHPAPPVVARYAQHTIRLVDSPHCGAMHWNSERPTELECQRELHLRYWHHHAP
jgi:competence protein ComEC